MFFDILAVFVVSIISSLLLCTTSLHGLPPPPPPPSTLHFINSRSSADLPSSLRHWSQYYSLPNIDNDVVGGDDSEMLIGESNESSLPQSSTISNDDDNDDSSSSSFPTTSSLSSSSGEISNEPFDFYLQLSPVKSLSREFLSPQNRHHQQIDQHKRSSSPSSASNFNFNSAATIAALADTSNANNVVNLSQLSESTRLSPSLKILVETNPFARAWLTVLLQKIMQEQPVPYIFKYGRRRKK